MATFLFSLVSYAQSYQIELSNLVKKNNDWYQSNTPNILKKSGLNPKVYSSDQLADSSFPNAIEVIEINKAIEQRLSYTNEFGQLVIKYISPLAAAQALASNSKNSVAQANASALRLRDGIITYGQYNLEKQRLLNELEAKNNEVVQKYELKSK